MSLIADSTQQKSAKQKMTKAQVISLLKSNSNLMDKKEDPTDIANKNGLQTANLKTFVENIMSRMIFDGEKLTDLLEPSALSWKERRVKNWH